MVRTPCASRASQPAPGQAIEAGRAHQGAPAYLAIAGGPQAAQVPGVVNAVPVEMPSQRPQGAQTRNGTISRATMLATLIIGLIAGPAVSL